MRILCLTARLPYPPDRGDRLRAFHFLEQLAGEHDLTLLSFIVRESERENLEPLRAFCRDVQVVRLGSLRSAAGAAANAWRRAPLQALYYRSAAMQRLVDRTLAQGAFDAAYVHLFRMAPYVIARRGLYRIVDLTDAISEEVARSLPYRSLPSRLLYGLEGPRVERYERHVAQSFEEAWLISETDRQALARSCPAANLHVVSNGVDTTRFYPLDGDGSELSAPPAGEATSLLFVGHLRVAHNVDAAAHLARDVLPRVRRQVPGCTLRIVGADPGPAVRRLAAEAGVQVVGYVPDLNLALNQAAVFVAPLRFAAGVQNKVLEAMAAARPVVTTSLVNAGLGARPGEEVLVADGPEEMAGQVVALLHDAALRRRIGRAGMEFVRRTFRWENVLVRMRAVQALAGQAEGLCASS